MPSLSKSKKSRSIPLNDSALWVLEQLPSKGKSEYLFPSPVTGKPYTGDHKGVGTGCARRRRFRRFDCTIYGTDSRPCSCRVAGRFTRYSRFLGHSDPKVTMRYAHLSAKALQDAANAASVIVRKPAGGGGRAGGKGGVMGIARAGFGLLGLFDAY
ncbi:MAG: hypothetical protein V9G11_05280 [Bifidobacterium adolescentis]